MKHPPRIFVLCLLGFLMPGWVLANGPYDRAWEFANLYENPESDGLQNLALSGRLQAEAYWFDADQGDDEDVLWRRFRFGFKAGFADNWAAQVEADFNLNSSADGRYNRLTDANISWRPSESTTMKFLKQSAGFTLDGATSSKKLLTLQRNNVTNNLWFTAEYFTGATISGKTGSEWNYTAGLFASDANDEIGVSDAGFFTLFSLSRDFADGTGLDKALLRVDYVYNDEDINANTRDFSQVLSLTGQWEKGQWGLWGDFSAGEGYAGQSDIQGLALMPFYNFSERKQLVFRYTWMDSEDPNGLRLTRYEREVVSGRGDRYSELFAGWNMFFYGHKFKWQTGLKYTVMKDRASDGGEYKGWGLTTGLRLSW